MNLDFLLGELGIRSNFGDVEVTSVTENVKNVKDGSLFVAVKGESFDGNSFISEAFSRGAAAVVTDKDIKAEKIIKVADARLLLGFLCSAFYSHPQYRMKMIGITGTNGKTTTAEYLRHIIGFSGKKCAVIGTLGSRAENYFSETGYTTPSAELLFSELKKLADAGNEYCIMEVSSQALAQKRVDPIEFYLSVFTNIGRDHTDYHGSMENYVREKTRLFSLSERSLINADDAYSEMFENIAAGSALSYSVKGKYADYMAKNIRISDDKISYILLKSGSIERLQFEGLGEYTVYNTLAAASAADILGIDFSVSSRALQVLPDVKGRAQKISANGKTVYIDFAHTPESLDLILKALKSRNKAKLICVFGCGGNRDRSKRSKMGAVAAETADTVILTSDNPRNENPDEIISDILKGINNKAIVTETDREKAISLAIEKAEPDDIVLIAGKGHEEYQYLNGEKKYFSDEITVKKLLGLM
ncbi:MAG: UDP-N-acetylmuramoyl-L-alanyl-D-glutamate--2,6-diaminopimelate ligase [Clostridia bacterium]|nr:UDP-N-acetylmuramoyl-L-alanyl-D-glutamate--2,6-diaminopimelate ligase [Clostridia bacterium]